MSRKMSYKDLLLYIIIKMDHIIYKITNSENGKIYVGKTKKWYGVKKFGIEGRFKKHVYDSENNKKGIGCPMLGNAIKKYGKEKFKIEQLEEIDAEHVDEKEEYYIKLYDSTHKDIGYNIALGGKGRKVVHVDEHIREKISKAQTKSEDSEMNIRPYKDKKTKEIIGYRARRREHNKYCEKYFTNTKFTLEENHQKSIEFIQAIKDNTENTYVKYNKETNLPKNISYVYDKNDKTKIIGYQVCIMQNGKTIHKVFQSKTISHDDLLKEATEYLDAIKNNKDVKCINRVKKFDLPSNIRHIRDEKDKNKIIGYRVFLVRNKKTITKSFQSKDGDLDELLEKAIKHKEDILRDIK
jgi:hypothetical protein